MYYNYHGRIKQRISNGELTGSEYVENYNGISPALLLYFSTEPKIRPIRSPKFDEYEKLLTKYQPK